MEKPIRAFYPKVNSKDCLGNIFFKKKIDWEIRPEKAVAGWTGPVKTDRDFVYDDLWYEVKTTNPGAPSLKISSIEQLDTDNEGRIVWVEAERTSSLDPLANVYPCLIAETKIRFGGFPEALQTFSMKILEAGFVDRKEYEDIHFACRDIKTFSVVPGFPRIRRNDIDTGIISASYDISIAQINTYKLLGEE
jgi:hypothetical protein